MKNFKVLITLCNKQFNVWWWNFLHSTHNSNTENSQQSQCHTTVNTKKHHKQQYKNKFQQHIYIKQHVQQCKDNEECPRGEVPYDILIISRTVVTTQNEAHLCHWGIIVFGHNPTAPWCTCLIFT